MPDIHNLREMLEVPANRTLPLDGKPYHTLPLIQDSGKFIGDTFEIALHLDKAYPDGPSLFRPHTTGLIAVLNAHVDTLFTPYAALCSKMPFRDVEAAQDVFVRRHGLKSRDDLVLSSEQREVMFVKFEAMLGELAKSYHHTGGTTDHILQPGGTAKAQSQRPGRDEVGPWLDGDSPVYADFIVGAWLKMMETCMPPEDWQRVASWQGGLWGRVVDALAKWTVMH